MFLSPDARRVLAIPVDPASEPQFFETTKGLPLGAALPLKGPVDGAVFRADGHTLLTATVQRDGTDELQLWDVGRSTLLARQKANLGTGAALWLSVDGKGALIATRWDNKLWHWTVGTTQYKQVTMPASLGRSGVTAFAPAAPRVCCTTDALGTVAAIWDVGRLNAGPRLTHPNAITQAVFSADGTRLAVLNGLQVHLWDTRTGKAVGAPATHSEPVAATALSANGQLLVTISAEQLVQVWRISSGLFPSDLPLAAPLHEKPPEGGDAPAAVQALAVTSGDTRVLVILNDGSLRWFDIARMTLRRKTSDP